MVFRHHANGQRPNVDAQPGAAGGGRRSVALAALLLTVLAVAATWPMATDPAHLALVDPTENDFRLNTYLIFWGAHALLTDPLAVHHTNMFHPEPYTFVYADILLAHSILMLPAIAAFNQPVLTYNLLLLASLVIGGVGFFSLARAVTGRDDAAFLGAVLWAFNPIHFTRFQQIQLFGDHWMPWMAWALWLWLRAGEAQEAATPNGEAATPAAARGLGYPAAAAAFFCLNALSGSHIAVFGALLAGTLVAYFAVVGSLWREPRFLLGCALFAVIAAGVLAPVFWPYWRMEEAMASTRAATLDLAGSSLHPLELLSARSHFYLWLDRTLGWPALINHSGRELSSYSFPGLLPLLLAGLGLLLPPGAPQHIRRTERRYWALACLLFVFLAMGVYGGYLLIGNLPLLRLIRVPTRYTTAAAMCLSMLAAYGVAAVGERISANRRRIAVLAALALVFAGESSYAPLQTWPYDDSPQPVVRFLAEQPGDFAVVEFPLEPFSYSINMRQVFASIHHWKRLLVGYSGYQSAENIALLRSFRDRFPSDACLDDMAALNVRFVVVLRDRVDPEQLDAIAAQPRLQQVHDFDGTLVYRMRPGAAAAR